MKRAFWTFITFWFVLSMHAQWAHAGAGSAALASTSFQEDAGSFDRLTPRGPQLDSMGWGDCTQGESDYCMTRCVDMAEGMGGVYQLQKVTCDIADSGQAHCTCTFNIPGPYNPPCYWNCGGHASRTGAGNGLY